MTCRWFADYIGLACSAPASHTGNAIDGIRYLCPRHAAAWRRLYGPVLALR